jgi:hypothetical protein
VPGHQTRLKDPYSFEFFILDARILLIAHMTQPIQDKVVSENLQVIKYLT